MSNIGLNIKYLRRRKGLTQQEFAELIGIKRSLIGSYEERRAEPKSDSLIVFANFFGVTANDLITERLSDRWFAAKEKREARKAELQSKSLRILSITVDKDNEENIELVPVKAGAGYLSGYADPEFVAELPKFYLPMLKGGSFRAFEIKGDSMLPLLPGTIIVGEYCEDWQQIKSGETYIVVSKNDGIVYKRVVNRLKDDQTFVLKSDHTVYEPYSISVGDVIEVWKAKAYISMNFPQPAESGDLSKLTSMMADLQKQVSQLQKR